MIDGLIYDWNAVNAPPRPRTVMLDDETLRDGLQSPSVRTPSIDDKLRILHLIDTLGIDTADIGLPGAGADVRRDVERLAREIGSQRLSVAANCAAPHASSTTSGRSPRSSSAPACRSSAACFIGSARRSASTPRAGRSTGCCASTEDAIALRGARKGCG